MRPSTRAVLGLLLLSSACAGPTDVALEPPGAPGPPPGTAPEMAASAPPAEEPRYACQASGEATAEVWTTSGDAQDDDDGPAEELRAFLRGETDNAGYDVSSLPTEGWRVIERGDDRVGYAVEDRVLGDGYVGVRVERQGEGWQAVAFGGCRPRRVIEGRGIAEWQLPETATVGPDTRAFTALVTETACTSGADPTDRLGQPEVVTDDDTVTVTFSTSPLEGGTYNCLGIAPVPVPVDLGEPLGDRVLRDGGRFPPADPALPGLW